MESLSLKWRILALTLIIAILVIAGVDGGRLNFIQAKPSDGCPYRVDGGGYGLVYVKPPACKKLLPVERNISQNPEYGPSPFWIKMYYTDDRDTFRVRVSSDDAQHRMYEVWIVTTRISSHGRFNHPVGFFLPKNSVQLYCCDWTNHRTSGRFLAYFNQKLRPFHTVDFYWSPLNFSGRFMFTANVFVTETNWHNNVKSRVFYMPPYWPEFLVPKSRGISTWERSEEDDAFSSEYVFGEDGDEDESNTTTTTTTSETPTVNDTMTIPLIS